MDRTLIESLIAKHEGRRVTVYRDTRGNMTVGKGFNLDRAGARESCAACGVDYDAVSAGEPLTDEQIEALFQGDVNAAIFAARCQLPSFDELPDAVQAVVVDMVFNLGSHRFSSFEMLKAALDKQPPDFAAAAAEIRNSKWCGQVKTRCEGNAEMMRNCASSVAEAAHA